MANPTHRTGIIFQKKSNAGFILFTMKEHIFKVILDIHKSVNVNRGLSGKVKYSLFAIPDVQSDITYFLLIHDTKSGNIFFPAHRFTSYHKLNVLVAQIIFEFSGSCFTFLIL